jgi:hypothetical protein
MCCEVLFAQPTSRAGAVSYFITILARAFFASRRPAESSERFFLRLPKLAPESRAQKAARCFRSGVRRKN